MNIKKLVSLFVCALLLCSALASCMNGNKRSVMEIDGYEVPYEVYCYVCVNSRRDIEGEYGADVWSSDNAERAKTELEENIKESLTKLYTVCALGRDLGIEWTDGSIEAAVNLKRNELVDEYGSEDDFKDALEEVALSDGAFAFIKSNEVLIDEIYMRVAHADEKNSDKAYLKELFMGDSFIRVKQILVGGPNAGTDEENLDIIKGIKAKLDSGADFDTVCREYNNDLYMFNNDAGYYITKGTRDLAFEDAAFSLEIGETSDIVKTASGYSIIKRYEKDADYIEKNLDSLTDEYYESLYTTAYEKKYDEVAPKLTSLPEDIDIIEIK